jgi:haloacid dehalogenase-like hydrolase
MNSQSCAFIILVVGLRLFLLLLPAAVLVVQGFHVATLMTNRRSNRLYAAKRQDDDFIEEDDDWFLSRGGGLFDPLGDYPLTNNNVNNNKKPNKLDLYSADELWNVLNIHQQLNDEELVNDENNNKNNNNKKANSNDLSKGITPDLHEMVLQALQQMEGSASENNNEKDENDAAATAPSTGGGVMLQLNDRLRSKLRKIRAIASDVDGTLVAAKYNVHPTTQAAVIKAVQAAYGDSDDTTKTNDDLQLFFLATGKSRAGAMESLGPEIQRVMTQQYSVPGVYIQGLYCVDNQGSVIFEKRLTKKAVAAATRFALDNYDNDNNLSMFGYNGDVILTTQEADAQHVHDYHDVWGEPIPIVIDSFVDYAPGFHKILFLSNNLARLKQQLRPKLDTLAVENNCATTQVRSFNTKNDNQNAMYISLVSHHDTRVFTFHSLGCPQHD